MQRPRAGLRAFTLVEVLVVIGVIVILLGILLPSLAGIRRESLASSCLSNLRQISIAHLSYMAVHKERFCDVGLPHGSLGAPERSFVNTLKPYSDGPLMFRSPLDASPHWPVELGGEGTPVNEGSVELYRLTSYGMNNYLSRTFSPLAALEGPGAGADALGRVRSPDSTVCFLRMADRGLYASSDHPHVEEWDPDPATTSDSVMLAATQLQVNSIDGQAPGESSRSTWSFVDGRVQAIEFGRLFESSTSNRFDPAVSTAMQSGLQ
jgi:type II secretory pathway pseudopilin PulG